MLTVLLVLQIIITLSMIIVILIQRSASDGMAGLAGGGNSLMSGRASANLLTRITSILAGIFILNSLLMAAMTARSSTNQKSIVDELKIEHQAPNAPLVDAPVKQAPANKAPSDAAAQPSQSDKNEPKPVVPIAE